MKRIIFIFLSMFLFSCASIEGPLYENVGINIPEGKACIVVFRIWSLTGSAWPAGFFLNGDKIASLNNHGFNYVFVDPGEYTVSHGSDEKPYHKKVVFIAKEGITYFVGLRRGSPDNIRLVEDLKGLKGYKLQSYKPL